MYTWLSDLPIWKRELPSRRCPEEGREVIILLWKEEQIGSNETNEWIIADHSHIWAGSQFDKLLFHKVMLLLCDWRGAKNTNCETAVVSKQSCGELQSRAVSHCSQQVDSHVLFSLKPNVLYCTVMMKDCNGLVAFLLNVETDTKTLCVIIMSPQRCTYMGLNWNAYTIYMWVTVCLL